LSGGCDVGVEMGILGVVIVLKQGRTDRSGFRPVRGSNLTSAG
jgi:hypothetical protein